MVTLPRNFPIGVTIGKDKHTLKNSMICPGPEITATRRPKTSVTT